MLQWLQRYRGIVVVSVLLAMPLILLYAQTKTSAGRGPVVGFFVDVASYIERGMLYVTGGVSDAIEHYVTSVASYDELVELRRHEASARVLEARIAELEWQNEELRRLARSMERIDGPRPLGARVVGRSGAPLSRILTIDRGSDDGIRRGDGVVSADGVVGQILVVGRDAADVLLLTDPSSAIDVVVQRTRARGVLRGAGEDDRYVARVDDFDRLRNVVPGDRVVTSGIGARFPPGLYVGAVEDAEAPDDSLYLSATVQPAARFATLEHVAVLIGRTNPRVPRLGTEQQEPVEEIADGGVVDGGPAEAAQPPSRPGAPAAAATPSRPTPSPTPTTAKPAPAAPSPATAVPSSSAPAQPAKTDGGAAAKPAAPPASSTRPDAGAAARPAPAAKPDAGATGAKAPADGAEQPPARSGASGAASDDGQKPAPAPAPAKKPAPSSDGGPR